MTLPHPRRILKRCYTRLDRGVVKLLLWCIVTAWGSTEHSLSWVYRATTQGTWVVCPPKMIYTSLMIELWSSVCLQGLHWNIGRPNLISNLIFKITTGVSSTTWTWMAANQRRGLLSFKREAPSTTHWECRTPDVGIVASVVFLSCSVSFILSSQFYCG